MDFTYADSRLLGITATFWYEYTASDYPLLGVQWSRRWRQPTQRHLGLPEGKRTERSDDSIP